MHRNSRLLPTTLIGLVVMLSNGLPCAAEKEIIHLDAEKLLPRPATMSADDLDHDGIPDAKEQALAELFAPIVHHRADEPHLPVNVDWLLTKTSLVFHDNLCKVYVPIHPSSGIGLTQKDLHWSIRGTCDLSDRFDSYGWADHGDLDAGPLTDESKERTFFLTDVAKEFHGGSQNTQDWMTYCHVYRNTGGGITIQYWRCYSYNTGVKFGKKWYHGGDWEGLHVVLDSREQVVKVYVINDDDGFAEQKVEWEGTHPKVYVDKGRHGTYSQSQGHQQSYRQEAWTGGKVKWPDGHQTLSGRLVNVGEKLQCLNDQFFIYYSGLWGSPGQTPPTGGYWGPAFNETDLKDHHTDGFIVAWAHEMAAASEEECYPSQFNWQWTATGELWQIDKPNVRRPTTPYSLMKFFPGDRITITAGGCVQTGGFGTTWKNYLHPDPSEMYYGECDLPSVTNGQEPLSRIVGRELRIGGDLPIRLRLGYRDDRHDDNGYWEHDNGTEDQCEGIGDAFLSVNVVRSPPSPIVMSGDASEIWCLAVSRDRRTIFSAGGRKGGFGEVKVWDLLERRLVKSYQRTRSLALSLALSDDGMTLATGEADGTVRFWNTSTDKEKWHMSAHVSMVNSLTFQRPDADRIISAGQDCDIRLWKTDGPGPALWTKHCRGPVFAVTCTANGTKVLSGGRGPVVNSEEIAIRATSNGESQKELKGNTLPLRCVTVTGDGRFFMGADGSLTTLSEGASVYVWDAETGSEVRTLNGHKGPVVSIAAAVYQGHPIVATGSFDRTVRIWSIESGKQLAILDSPNSIPLAIAFDLSVKHLVVADSTRLDPQGKGAILLWELGPLIARALSEI